MSLARAPRARLWLVVGGAGVAAAAIAWLAFHRGSEPAPAPPPPAPLAPQQAAAPPAPPPAPDPAPAPSEIKLKFVSAPSGATVRIAGSRAVLGVTPFTKSFPRSEQPITFELEKAGYVTIAAQTTLIADDAVAVTLSATSVAAAPSATRPPVTKPTTPPKPSQPPAQGSDRNGTMSIELPK